ncbi:SDR family NAD(P)-dependent oxidoreductase [Azospirillum sp. sgz302134]
MRDPRSIVITGASSGIGEELAYVYAATGAALALTGRDAARLGAVAERCRALGATVESAVLDAADRDAMSGWLAAVDRRAPVDLVIANAGISAGTGHGTESEEQARRIFQVNLDGVLNTIHPLLPAMQTRRRGQIALMASLASFRGMPGAPAYCASKAAVRVYGESLRGDLAGQGIGVSVICPGFVKSRMTAVNRFPMPFLMDTDRAARVIRRGLARNKARISFPWPMAAAVWLLAALPPGLTDGVLRQAPRKP